MINKNDDGLQEFNDITKPFEKRVDNLVSNMTLKEKVSQMLAAAPAIPRLGIPQYNWWNECLHGVARAGIATVFPQAIGLAATFNPELVFKIASAISDEARAKHHEFLRQGRHGRYQGLTFWSPNINIFRDPRWGRGQETYGEDPFLSGTLAVEFIKGLQGSDEKYLKVIATPKHFAVHSGPEKSRHHFNVDVSLKDLHETYLPAFRMSIVEGKAESIMGAYNRLFGVPCCASELLLEKLLRKSWGFKGFVVSDCGAIRDFHGIGGHGFTKDAAHSSAIAVQRGCDLNCGRVFRALKKAIKKKLIDVKDIDKAVKRLFLARLKLGMFDPQDIVPHASIPFEINDCEKHRQLALLAARESIVLLKNKDDVLPIKNFSSIKKILVTGPNADHVNSLLGNYNGEPSKSVTPIQGIVNVVGSKVEIVHEKGCNFNKLEKGKLEKAVSAAEQADIIIACMGINPRMEGEQRTGKDDRRKLELPGAQQTLLENLRQTGKTIILVLLNGSPLAVPWAQENVEAIIEAWYPGEEGGNAIADVIFGKYSPAGKLPVTFPKSTADLPPFDDYTITGKRTYKYLEKEPLYPFGFGLSYSSFVLENLTLEMSKIKAKDSLNVSVVIKNEGNVTASETIQLYVKALDSPIIVPKHSLQGFRRIYLLPKQEKMVKFTLKPRQLSIVDENGKIFVNPGNYRVFIGGRQPDDYSGEIDGSMVLQDDFEITGEKFELNL
ncbi:MAG: glycoside hydrolase family 3 C-terminal domain-containing protein [Promethearchaeota archaeon]